MATRQFRENFEGLENITQTLDRIDLQQPENNIINKEASTYELLQIQAETQTTALNEALNFIKDILPLEERIDEDGTKIPVQAQRDQLKEIAEKNNLITRMVQTRQREKGSKQQYFDNQRDPICQIPEALKTNVQNQVSDTALKLLSTFKGDTNNESDNLKTFLRNIYDVATTNQLSEGCTNNIIKRKLGGTARKILDAYTAELNQPNRPSLKETVLKLENRYMSDLQPEIAAARLAMMKIAPNQTYQSLEGDISELVTLAARAENGNTKEWIKNRKIETFKQAIEEKDRQLLSRENQSRTINGIAELSLSEAVDFLIKTYSEKNAFIQANNLKKTNSNIDTESINKTKESTKSETPKTGEKTKKEDETSIKDEIFRLFQQSMSKSNNSSFRGRGNNRFNNRGRNGRGNRGRGGQRGFNHNQNGHQSNRQQTNNQQYNNNKNSNQNWNNNGSNGQPNHNYNRNNSQRGNNHFNRGRGNRSYQGGGPQSSNNRGWNKSNYRGNNKNNTPRKFVTPEQVNVGANNCLKCNSPSHRFQETDKCVYGNSNLMTQPCLNCGEGGHHSSLCIRLNKSTIGAPQPIEQRPLDPSFSKWPEPAKAATEKEQERLYSLFPEEKNSWTPRF